VPRLYWEDFNPGHVTEFGPRLVTRDEIVEFAAEFDPQPMHLDDEAARATMLGGLSASGWHGCCIMMRMIVDSFLLDSSSMGAPGIDEVRWLRPIRPGEQLILRTTVLETRVSKSKPDRGFVKFQFELIDAGRNPMTTLTTSLMMGRRDARSGAA
jgi:acyl dehydratase